MRHAILITILFLFIAVTSNAQDRILKDDTVEVKYAEAASNLRFKDFPYYDLKGFQHYRPFGRLRVPLARSGNLGLASHSYFVNAQDWDINYIMGAYQPYLMNKDSLRYYKTSRPFTALNYMNGSESEQFFDLQHTQNLGEGLNIWFNYRRTVSEGFFSNQLTNHTQFNTTYNLRTRDQRFESKGYFIINSMEAQENGGIFVSPNDNPDDNTALLDIRIRSAQNKGRTQALGFTNSYDLLLQDSALSLINLEHQIEWSKAHRNYQDDFSIGNAFYNEFFLDSVRSSDSSYVEKRANTFFLNVFGKKYGIGYRDEQYMYFQNFLLKERIESQYVMFRYEDSLLNREISIHAEKGIGGYHEEELDLRAEVDLISFFSFDTKLRINVSQKQPDYFLIRQRLNHHYNDFEFNTSDQLGVEFHANSEKYKTSFNVGFKQMNGLIYFDSLLMAQQTNKEISQFYIQLRKHFVFLNHLNLVNNIQFQSISNEELLPMPSLITYHSFYYEDDFFKNALRIQVGADLYWINEYEGYAYNPSLAQFHLRRQGEQLGNIQQLDLFLNVRINKGARLFIKMENVLLPNFSEESYRIEDYPIPGRALKYGLSWRMIN